MNEDKQKIYLNYLQKPRIICTIGKRQMDLPVTIHTLDTLESFSIKALVDSGCTGSCINSESIKRNNLNTKTLPRVIPVYNADGTLNIGGLLTEMIQIKIQVEDHFEIMDLGVSKLGNSDLFLGHNWLQHHNPEVDWVNQMLIFTRCPNTCWNHNAINKLKEEEEILRTFQTTSTKIAIENKKDRTTEKILPEHYKDYKSVFEKTSFDKMPPKRPWDHAIDLVPGSKPMDCKLYPL